jgi:glycosyltransferase involved in cell wall biosynthesis/predicted glycoside hydrolase/deacetylase ChbG (UPF0249 family)
MQLEVDNLREVHHGPTSSATLVCDTAEADDLQQDAIVILNADDWGWNVEATNRILECIRRESVSSVSAMVFMEASERAAALAREFNVDAGLHLNFTTPFSGRLVPPPLLEHQARITSFLRSHRYSPILFEPTLMNSFDYVVRRQYEEYERNYGAAPHRIDGHHHMHLCTNVLLQGLLTPGVIVRRNLSFAQGEKRRVNRWFRSVEDALLARRHRTTDYFFDLLPLDIGRMKGICELARHHNVEIETHPARADEHRFLVNGGLARFAPELTVARGYLLRGSSRFGDPKGTSEPGPTVQLETPADAELKAIPHICVCICTYKRAEPLRRLLKDIDRQDSGGLFTFSIVVADNDPDGSAKSTVEDVAGTIGTPVKYCAEPRRGIARARNTVVANAEGDYLALIDDDEFPISDWLKILLTTCRRYNVDGVLGPVKRHFDEEPPSWLKKSSLYDRAVNPTGMQVEWKDSRSGNVLMKREVVQNDPMPFRPEFRSGEDHDFFRRKIEDGHRFVWSGEAAVYEVIPPSRWTRLYYIRKALMQGSTAALQPNCGPGKIAKSLIAVPLYTLLLPFALLAGQSHFMTLLVKLCDHAGRLLRTMNIDPIREEYVSE